MPLQFVAQGPMLMGVSSAGGIALISHTSVAPGSGGGTTAAINTTGATLIVIVISAFTGGAGTTAQPTDSKGNTYIGGATQVSPGNDCVELWYCVGPITDAAHTFTCTAVGSLPAISVAAYSGASGIDQTDTGAGTSSTAGALSITPTTDAQLVIAGLVQNGVGVTINSVSGGLTIRENVAQAAGNNEGGALADLIQTTAAAATPAFTLSGSADWSTVIASFFKAGSNTWSSTKKDAAVTLSNGNLTFTNTTGAFENGYARISAINGKKYWEVTPTVISGANFFVGIVGAADYAAGFPVAATFLGNSVDSASWDDDGRYFQGGNQGTLLPSFTTGDTCCIALDLDAKKVWFRKNGGNWNNDILANQNPATGTGGFALSTGLGNIGSDYPLYAGYGMQGATDSGTANFGATAYAQTPPSGFGNW